MVHVNDLPVETLVNRLVQAKALEVEANRQRIQAEELLIARLGSKPESRQSHMLDSGDTVVITSKMIYHADMPALIELSARLPDAMRPVRIKTELDQTAAKYLRNNEIEAWKVIAPAITIKPAKTSVEIKSFI